MKGDSLQQYVDFIDREKNISFLGCFGCLNVETFMEVDVVEQFLVVVLNLVGGQNVSVKDIGVFDFILDDFLMEIEILKCDFSFEILSNFIFIQDLQFLESNVEMFGINKECGEGFFFLNFCGNCQFFVELVEEVCLFITVVLKEFYEFLVISNKLVLDNIFEEVIY